MKNKLKQKSQICRFFSTDFGLFGGVQKVLKSPRISVFCKRKIVQNWKKAD